MELFQKWDIYQHNATQLVSVRGRAFINLFKYTIHALPHIVYIIEAHSMNLEFHLLLSRHDKECESKTLLGWRALERRLERYETEIKFRHKMCFNLFRLPQKNVNFQHILKKRQLRMALDNLGTFTLIVFLKWVGFTHFAVFLWR